LGDQARREAALAELAATYWKPVYYYVRHKGHDEESAKDLTQGFFQKMLSSHGVVQKADPARGRFRTFLLTCLNRYLSDVFRTERTKRHMPAGGLVSLETVNWAKAPQLLRSTTPLEAFDYAWGCALLDKVLAEVEAKCREKGTVAQWELFGAKVLEPIRDNVDPPSLTCLCEKYGIANKTVASNMIYTVKRRCPWLYYDVSDARLTSEAAGAGLGVAFGLIGSVWERLQVCSLGGAALLPCRSKLHDACPVASKPRLSPENCDV
jgi:DNA-directed RNA polymerase specialized sigma24 family protein